MHRNFSRVSQIQSRNSSLLTSWTFFLSLEFELVYVSVFTYDLDFLILPSHVSHANVSQCLHFPSISQYT